MTRENFKYRLKNIELNQKNFAKITGYGYSTVKGWESIPQWVDVVLNYMEVFHKMRSVDKALSFLEDIKKDIHDLNFLNYDETKRDT